MVGFWKAIFLFSTTMRSPNLSKSQQSKSCLLAYTAAQRLLVSLKPWESPAKVENEAWEVKGLQSSCIEPSVEQRKSCGAPQVGSCVPIFC